MYQMRPLHQVENIPVPSVMYQMKSLHEVVETDDPDMKTLLEKDRKIADDLVALTNEVKELSLKLGHTFGQPSTTTTGMKSITEGTRKLQLSTNLPNGITDLVISTSVAQPAFSAALIGEFLQQHGIHTAMIAQKHSSLVTDVPENYLAVTNGLGSRLQHTVDKLAFTFVWKASDPFTPSLMHSPSIQTRVMGDANIARYLARLLVPQLYNEDDVAGVAAIDRWIDSAVQLYNGNSKEKDSVVKAMNSHLGKNDYFCGGSVTLADVTLLGALLANSDHVKTLPKNAKKWFQNMSSHFGNTISRFGVPATWTSQ